ncbi:MAG: transcriptional repressor [Oscillospiraceae bacterium]
MCPEIEVKRLRSDGYSTKIYNAIMGFLRENQERAVTASDVYEHLVTESEKVNKTTVYRNLDRLVSDGTLLKYVTDDGKKASFIFHRQDESCIEHLHLQCSDCGRVIHLDCDYMEDFIRHISDEHDFNLRCGSSILYGLCKDCEAKRSGGD